MIKENKMKIIVSSIITLLPILFGVTVWNKLPEKLPTHWGPDGSPDQYSSKLFAVVCLPLIVFALHWLTILFSGLDPKNKRQNNKVFGLVFWICPAVSVLCSAFTYAAGLNFEFNVSGICMAFMGILFIVTGNYMPKCKQNFTIGIKIPWTLNDEDNWNATHRFAGKVWVIGGILSLPTAFLPANIVIWTLVVIIPLALLPIIYSGVYHKKHSKENNNG